MEVNEALKQFLQVPQLLSNTVSAKAVLEVIVLLHSLRYYLVNTVTKETKQVG